MFERIILHSTALVSCFCSLCFILRVGEVMAEGILQNSTSFVSLCLVHKRLNLTARQGFFRAYYGLSRLRGVQLRGFVGDQKIC